MDNHHSNLKQMFIASFESLDTIAQNEVIHSICSPLAYFNPKLDNKNYDVGLLFEMMYAQGEQFSELPLSLLNLQW